LKYGEYLDSRERIGSFIIGFFCLIDFPAELKSSFKVWTLALARLRAQCEVFENRRRSRSGRRAIISMSNSGGRSRSEEVIMMA
jgi:hypothetical protein